MNDSPRRLRRLTGDRPPILPGPGLPGLEGKAPMWPPEGQNRMIRRARAVRRGILVLIWTLIAMAVQSICVLLPGHAKVWFARIYWSVSCWLIGFRIRVIGVPATRRDPAMARGGKTRPRPVVFVSNHSSWLDIAVLGGRLDAAFISKDEVSRWPVVRTIARLGRTVFVTRQRANTGRERDAMRARLAKGDSLILFPEGTSSDGSRVLPFRSAFFAVAEGEAAPLIQPVSLVYDRLGFLPAGRASRPVFAWYGDMNLAGHFWRLAQYRGLRATILLHTPLDPATFPNRKALSAAVWKAVADGASTLRQNRPARPLAASDWQIDEFGKSATIHDGGQPAYV